MSRIELDLKDVNIPRLSELQKQILQASNNNPDETIVTLDNAAVVAIRQPKGPFSLSRTFEWHAHVMSGVTHYRDFTVSVKQGRDKAAYMDEVMHVLSYEMARQRITPEDVVTALQQVDSGDQIEHFDIQPDLTASGKPVAFTQVDTRHDAPGVHA